MMMNRIIYINAETSIIFRFYFIFHSHSLLILSTNEHPAPHAFTLLRKIMNLIKIERNGSSQLITQINNQTTTETEIERDNYILSHTYIYIYATSSS